MINAIDVQRRIAAFSERHGPSVCADGWVYYADGATRDGNSLGPMNEPPREPRLRCRNIVKYHQTVLDGKVREFDELKCQLKEDANAWAHEEKNLKQLEGLRRRTKWCRRKLNEANQELRRQMPGYRPPEEERRCQQIDAATEAAKSRYRDKLDAINI